MRRRFLAAAAAATMLLAGGCGDGEPDDGLTEITVGAIPIIDVAPLHLGIDQGFFEEQGLDVTVQNTNGGAQAVPGVVSGDFDLAFGNVTSLIVALDQGLPLRSVANGVATTGQQGEDFGAVVVPEDSDVTDVSELGDATIAVNNLENIGDTSVRDSIREAGGDPSGVEFLELDFPDMPAALDQGEIDAAWVVEPFLSSALDAGATELASNFADVHDELTIAVYFTSEQVLQEAPETVEAFATAMDASLAHADDNPDEVRRIIGDYTEIDPDLIENMRLPAFPPEPNTESVRVLADLMEEDGLVDDTPDLDELFVEQP